MTSYKTVEQEVNKIRLEIYEETKNITPSQYTERVRKIGEETAKNMGSSVLQTQRIRDRMINSKLYCSEKEIQNSQRNARY